LAIGGTGFSLCAFDLRDLAEVKRTQAEACATNHDNKKGARQIQRAPIAGIPKQRTVRLELWSTTFAPRPAFAFMAFSLHKRWCRGQTERRRK